MCGLGVGWTAGGVIGDVIGGVTGKTVPLTLVTPKKNIGTKRTIKMTAKALELTNFLDIEGIIG